MRTTCLLLLITTTLCFNSCNKSTHIEKTASNYDSTWWNRRPVRLIQTNLREIDANMDREAYVQSIIEMNANAVLLNVGGIVANYPTELDFHWKNTFMEGDLVGDLIEKLHENNIRVIGRFDFSKLNEAYAFKNPDWLYKSLNGEYVNYNGQVHTCVNGGYNQEYAFKILEEAIVKYPLDGVFFNMIGYKTNDYSGNYHGICQCDNCKQRFYDSTGHQLPTIEDKEDPVFIKYADFKKKTAADLFYRIRDFVKSLDSNLVIDTYTSAGVDWRRRESETFFNQIRDWNYSATDHVRADLCTYPDKIPSNAARHFMGLAFRHSACPDQLTRIRLTANLLNGALLDFYCIGPLHNHEDKFGFDFVKDIYTFQVENEYYFNNLRSKANICLIKGDRHDYRGLIRMLSGNHLQFDIIHAEGILKEDIEKPLESYELLIVNNLANMSNAQIARLDAYVENGGKMLVTGMSSTRDAIGNPLHKVRLKSLGVEGDYTLHKLQRGTYFKITEEDKDAFNYAGFEKLSLSYFNSDFLQCKLKDGATGHLKFIPQAMYGPPERCYYDTVTEVPGLITNNYGKGKTVFIPWLIGELYDRKGHHSHDMIFMASVLNLLDSQLELKTDVSSLIEVNRMERRDGAFEFIGLINHSGQLGASFYEPLEIRDINFELQVKGKVRNVKTLRKNENIAFKQRGNSVQLNIASLNDFEMVVVEY